MLKIVVPSGCFTEFNGYRAHQRGAGVELEVFNTVYDPDDRGCLAFLRVTEHTVRLPRPAANAEVRGGCPETETDPEDMMCELLRRFPLRR